MLAGFAVLALLIGSIQTTVLLSDDQQQQQTTATVTATAPAVAQHTSQ